MLRVYSTNPTETVFEDNKRNNFEIKEDLKLHIKKTCAPGKWKHMIDTQLFAAN